MHDEKKTHLLELKDNFPKIDFSIVHIEWENFLAEKMDTLHTRNGFFSRIFF